MSPDSNHRAPSRLAPIRPGKDYPKPSPLDVTTAGTRPSPSRDFEPEPYDVIGSAFEDEPQVPDEPTYEEASTYEHTNGSRASRSAFAQPPATLPDSSGSRRNAVLPSDALDWQAASMPSNPNELSKKERYQLLMETVQYYEDHWKLASIRTLHGNRMAAYLTPCKKHLDLKSALARQQVMVIWLDQHGNSDIKEPRPRSLIQRFLDWLRGG